MSEPVARQQGVLPSVTAYDQRMVYHELPMNGYSQGPRVTGYTQQTPVNYTNVASLPSTNNYEVSNDVHRHVPTPEASFQSGTLSFNQSVQPADSTSAQYSRYAPPSISSNHDRDVQTSRIDHADLLLLLADEYLAVAYQLNSNASDDIRDQPPKEYYRLIATALGCLETVLAKCKLKPAQEAVVRLRYATVLYEETDNEMEAEEALSKGISIADRHKLFALKYNMQHLLIRILYVKRAPAALKLLENMIKAAEAYQHHSWVYALSFLKYSLHVKANPESRQDITSAFTILTKINNLAEERGDAAIVALVVTMKAWLTLKASNTQESFEEAQTLLAGARALMEKEDVRRTPQISIMVAFVDLCCYIQHFDPAQANEKLKHVHDTLQLIEQAKNWLLDGSFTVTIRRDDVMLPVRDDGLVTSGGGSFQSLLLNWYPKDDIYTVGYLLSGITMIHQSKPPRDRPEQMLKQGISKGSYDQQQSNLLARPIMTKRRIQLWRQHLNSYMRLYLAFMLSMRSNWDSASRQLKEFQTISEAWSFTPPALKALSRLFEATYFQGIGSLPHAINIYQSLVNLRAREPFSLNHMMDDICRIASLNSLMIIRNPSHEGHQSAIILFSNLKRDCPTHPNRQIQAAYNLVNSTLLQSTTIIGRKQTLQLALNAAKASYSNTSLCIALSLMHWYFFREQVTEQAEKSARAAQNMANRVENKMWMSTTSGILGDHLEAAGRSAEAAAAYAEGSKAAEGLPSQVKSQLGWVQGDQQADLDMSDSIQ